MNKTTRIVFSSLLILVFSFFSVGVPVVQYLCPMMSGENPTCDMSPAANTGTLTISTETPACCAKNIGAERNTTPFLKVEKHQTVSLDILADVTGTVDPVSLQNSFYSITPTIHYSTPPLFVLHSAFLI